MNVVEEKQLAEVQAPQAASAKHIRIECDGSIDPAVSEIVALPRPEAEKENTASTHRSVAEKPHASKFFIAALRRVATLGVSLVAVLAAVVTWHQYVTMPWTRDGVVRVQVASIAPEVSGRIVELGVADNQFVHKGDILYKIDPIDFNVALLTSRATLEQRQADSKVKQLQSERRRRLSDLATTPEEQQLFEGSAVQAMAAVDAAQQQLELAQVNLNRTEVRSTVNGYVTNLLLRQGDYARQGVTNVSVIDTDSFWIDGYFEETKLAGLCVGDRAEALLVGYASPIVGHVTTVTRGVSVSNAAIGAQGLPNVDPVYTWVRLAQRVPVRIRIDDVPPGVPLVSGTTATVTVRNALSTPNQSWSFGLKEAVARSLSDLTVGVSPRPNCIPANGR